MHNRGFLNMAVSFLLLTTFSIIQPYGSLPFITSSALAADNAVILTAPSSPPSLSVNFRSIGSHEGALIDSEAGIAPAATVWQGDSQLVLDVLEGQRLPENIGKGDRLILEPGSDDEEILFILSRSFENDNEFELQSAASLDHVSVEYAIERAYPSIQAWEDDRQGNLVGDNRREVGVCYDDGPFLGGAVRVLATISGSNTNAENFMWVTVARDHQHNGRAGTGVVLDGQDSGIIAILIQDDYTRVEGLEIKRFRGRFGAAAIKIRHAEHVYCGKLLIHDFDSPPAYESDIKGWYQNRFMKHHFRWPQRHAFGIKGSYDSSFIARNCIIYDGGRAGIRLGYFGGEALVDSCTIYGMQGRGISELRGVMTVSNTISMENGKADFDIEYGDQFYNLSSDDTAGGPGSLTGLFAENQFVSLLEGGEDLHLKDGADAIDAGPVASPGSVTDIDGEPRPLGPAWDMGADEFNTAPVAHAGEDQEIVVGDTVYLDGNKSEDADGQGLYYIWEFISVPEGSNAVILNPDSVSPSFVADMVGDYEVELMVSDGYLLSLPDSVVITAIPKRDLIAVPDVVGLLLYGDTGAQNAIEDAGLLVGDVKYEKSDTAAGHPVINQDPEAGELVEEGSSVDLVAYNIWPQAHNRDYKIVNFPDFPPLLEIKWKDELTSDADKDTLTVIHIEVTEPFNGTLEDRDGVLDYTPNEGFDGIDTFKYTVSDGRGGIDVGTVTIEVQNPWL